ncbi:4'-phosphopantetheinyl transferase superfamily protein [Clostridium sp. DJ247]|uniref:4'-phosphopantetheinyl transferase family protein n=1 Tax=Clostridium sp. DJ247 TaxID=2726188 RepID=UPI0016246FEA|nr:4'-phosphopantetheinyl transferase superfamily protein [Clostridium sp. DJ247]MBC2582622.1 4'-phosphopantetheinyl transferase superfamily protein [Clostridium sp. DJ247]
MKIYALKCIEISNHLFNVLIKFISQDKRNKIYRFMNNNDKYRALISEILIRTIIHEELNMPNDKICIIKNEYGKPYLKSFKNFHFNISHSGDWVVCADDDKPIGIDIEKIQPIEYSDLSKRFYTEKECKFIFNSSLNEQLNNFYRIWTLKESYVKADGRGLSIPLKSFSIDINDYENIKVFTSNKLKDCYFKEFNFDSDYKMSVCSVDNIFTSEVDIISQNNLIYRFMSSVMKGE